MKIPYHPTLHLTFLMLKCQMTHKVYVESQLLWLGIMVSQLKTSKVENDGKRWKWDEIIIK